MEKFNLSSVERSFFEHSKTENISTRIPYITVENFPTLGLFTALRFIEWVSENPTGVISLPTGKTPEYFIKWTKRIVDNWNDNPR
jgi:glucosamine-6-phosphate deaminase